MRMAGREGRRKLPRRQSSFPNVALLLLLPIGGLLVSFAWMFVRSVVPNVAPRRRAPLTRSRSRETTLSPRGGERVREAAVRGNIVLILDDVGFDHQPL